MTETLRTFADEVTRVASEVGAKGLLGGQAQVPGAAGTWKDLTDSVNTVFRNLTTQVRDIAQVTTAVANGDLSQKVTVDVAGEMLELKNTVNTMVDQLSAFGAEVTRVAREIGVEGELGGQAQVPGAAGYVEGPHGLGQHRLPQPHRPGAQHRAGDDGGGQRRSVAEGHRGRLRRDAPAEEHREHDGGPAVLASPTR